MTLRVNGVEKQRFLTGDMTHGVQEIIAYVSRGMELLPGDVILTGTAAGVGVARVPPEFLGADGRSVAGRGVVV